MLLNLKEARVVIEDYRRHYNEKRPHSGLGYLSPAAWGLVPYGELTYKPTKDTVTPLGLKKGGPSKIAS